MNYRLVCRFLGVIALLIAVTMLFSLPWAYPSWGTRNAIELPTSSFEANGFYALSESILICAAVGLLLIGIGGRAAGALYQKEALAVVGFAWILATILGGLPFFLSGTYRGPPIRIAGNGRDIFVHQHSWFASHWFPVYDLSKEKLKAVRSLVDAGSTGLPASEISDRDLEILRELQDGPLGSRIVLQNDENIVTQHANLQWVRMTFVDSLFESQSGFSTTGATVISDLENPALVPHCILFWRSSTHFLGGLGIIVLFVAILGSGSAGKALMRNEVPGPAQESSDARMQHTAQVFASIYCGLTLLLTLLLRICGLSWFDSLCHAFGTMATGGFSTYNASLGHFDSGLIDAIVILFMVMAGMNFTLLYFLLRGVPSMMFGDIEWRTYIGIILIVTLVVVVSGLSFGEFTDAEGQSSWINAIRYGLFQVVSIITTTGYGTHDFNGWNQLSRCLLLLLMFIGGCSGSTGGGLKVIRWILMTKILGIELERAHHPRVVRTLRLGGKAIDDDGIRQGVFVYFVMIGAIFLVSWLMVVGLEPNATWAGDENQKLMDSASAVVATLNNIGPGLGTVGATQNYGHFSASSKLLFTVLMMLGRVEVFAILVLLMPSFWRTR